MGLDMFLFKRKKFRENDEEYNKLVRDTAEEIGYWRKANEIRNWIIDKTELEEDDNCKYIELSKKDLEDLREDCIQVLEDHTLAEEIMPTKSGFFFGDTNYDDYYFNSLGHTIRIINNILENTNFEIEAIDYFDWW